MILWNLLYLLSSHERSPRLSSGGNANGRRRGSTPLAWAQCASNRGTYRGMLSTLAWTKTLVFLHRLARCLADRCFLYACYGNPVYR
jgi:hypothetical protein